MKIFDTHIHLDVMKEAIPKDEIVLSIGYKDAVNRTLQLISQKYRIPFSVGIAPQVAMYETFKKDHIWLKSLKNLVKNKLCVAVGEVGLDNKWASKDEHRKRQRKWLNAQLDIAENNGLPLVIHSRKAEDELVQILEKKDFNCVFHAFGGKKETAQKIIDNGWYMGITPTKSKDKKKVISLGIENLVVETDAPFIGKNFKDIHKSIERIKEVLTLTKGEIIKITFDNGIRLFRMESYLRGE
jgi:TatD DNase family protein